MAPSGEQQSVLRLVSWNIRHSREPWESLLGSGYDIALLQEAGPPPPEVESTVDIDPGPWVTEGQPERRRWRTAVVRLSEDVRMSPRATAPLGVATGDTLPVSRMGTVATADVEVTATGERLTVASIYGLWEHPIPSTESAWIYADASAHRVLSDLSALIGREKLPPLIVSGDLNILYGHGEDGNTYWKERYQSFFSRAAAMGLRFVGPQAPEGGDPAEPRPAELPPDSRNVPTYRSRMTDPSSARRQLDFVFASEALAHRVHVRALNLEEDWGPSALQDLHRGWGRLRELAG